MAVAMVTMTKAHCAREMLRYLLLGVLVCCSPELYRCARGLQVGVTVLTDRVIQIIDKDLFLGVTLDCYLMQDNWEGFDFSNRRMLNMAKGIAPSLLRIGGTACDSLTFDPKSQKDKVRAARFQRPPFTTNFTMSAKDWDNFNEFVKTVGWKMIFGINAKKRDGRGWDPWNALQLLQYSALRGYPLYGLELSNEPELFPQSVSVEPEQLGKDFTLLRAIQQSMPSLAQTLIIGPDSAQADTYFDRFVKSEGGEVVKAATFHHYYFNGRTGVLSQFLNPSIMDSLKGVITKALGSGSHVPGLPVWLGETSSAYNTGAPGISNTYVAGFLWMDKLGMSSKMGLKAVIRQDFYGGNYSLVQQNTFYPYPDYYLTVLYKRLVGSEVFDVTVNSDSSVRVYAHCAKQNTEYGYGPGSVVLYAINLKTVPVTLSLPQYTEQTRHVFWLSPYNDTLTATSVQLNGTPLQLVDDDLPPLKPLITTSPLLAPPRTMGFLVLPDADVKACIKK